ncbi:MAG: 23S rRNA (adenine(2503)-C(2))-methyltransferase RlmN [Nitrospira sp.]|nr:23S rRNA (adenine(2503)-C(2))-methyltransferase RlmN [Nitrospira sp.]
MKPNLKALNFHELQKFVQGMGWPRYRADQIWRWIYQKGITDFSGMTDLSQADRSTLEAQAYLSQLKNITVQDSVDGTRKFLFGLEDGQSIETVLIPDERETGQRGSGFASQSAGRGGIGERTLRRGRSSEIVRAAETVRRPDSLVQPHEPPHRKDRLTLCVSTQVGCTLDCAFCLTGRMGLKRNLRVYEIVDQMLVTEIHLKPAMRRITNIVMMGMGEPLANFYPVVEAIHRMSDPRGIGFSQRRITVSTAGLVPQIRMLGTLGLKVNLAVSLNATTDETRNKIMGTINQKYPLKELIQACREYPLPPRRQLTFEYVLLKGINDSLLDAQRLVKLLRGIHCKVNLIPYNEHPGADYKRPQDTEVLRFQKVLIDAGLHTFIRKSKGRDILAACGQLETADMAQHKPLS